MSQTAFSDKRIYKFLKDSVITQDLVNKIAEGIDGLIIDMKIAVIFKNG